jgi:acyl-CoA:acyl-CoA alkyltransferase
MIPVKLIRETNSGVTPQEAGRAASGPRRYRKRTSRFDVRQREVTSRITGIGIYIPERRVTNDDVLKLLEAHSISYLSEKDFAKLMSKAREQLDKSGNVTRYWCKEDQYCTDIARIAAERALADAGMEAEELDLILFTGMSKAFVEPATAHVLRTEIGAYNANVMDTQDACTSFMKSIELADSLIQCGRYGNVLVVAGERTFDWADFTCKTVYELDWKFGSLTIGDAAGAVVLQPTREASYARNPKHMRFFYHIEDGTFATCHIGLNHRVGERYRLHSHSSRLIRTGLKAIMSLVVDILHDEEFQGLRYDNLFIHDIGKMIDDLVLPSIRKTEVCVPDTYRSYFPEYGNVASVSFPLGLWLAREQGRLTPGNLCAFICPAAGVQAGVMFFVY